MTETRKPTQTEISDTFRSLGTTLNEVQQGQILTEKSACFALSQILGCDDPMIDHEWVALFSAIQTRGASKDEIKGFMRAAASFDDNIVLRNDQKPNLGAQPLYAICGSGKDTWKTFNISTAASFIAASCGVKVLKPGSSSVSSVSGNLDVIGQLKMCAFDDENDLKEALEKTGIAVASFHNLVPRYAERYDGRFASFHPLSYVMPVAAIPYKIDGISYGIADSNVELGRDVISEVTGIKKIVVASSKNSRNQITDEFCPFGTRRAATLVDGHKKLFEASEKGTFEQRQAIQHGDTHEDNAQKIVESLPSKRDNPTTKTACYAAATILHEATGKNLRECYLDAVNAVESGQAYKKMLEYRDFCKDKKRESVGIKTEEHELAP